MNVHAQIISRSVEVHVATPQLVHDGVGVAGRVVHGVLEGEGVREDVFDCFEGGSFTVVVSVGTEHQTHGVVVSIDAAYVVFDIDMSLSISHLILHFFASQGANAEEAPHGQQTGHLWRVEQLLEPVFERLHQFARLQFGPGCGPFGREIREGLGHGDLRVFDKLVQVFELPIRLEASNFGFLSVHLRCDASECLR